MLERAVLDLDAHAEAAERGWAVHLDRGPHPARAATCTSPTTNSTRSFVRLWFGGRVSPAVVEEVHARNRALARRTRTVLLGAGLVPADTPEIALDMLVELGDRSPRDGVQGRTRGDGDIIETGAVALTAFLERMTQEAP